MKPAIHHKDPTTGECREDCWPCKLRSVTFAPSAMVTRSPEAARAKVKDPLLAKDLDAYKTLRRQGTQPRNVVGSAQLAATAEERHEITTGRVESDPLIRRRTERMFRDMPAPSAEPIVREPA